MKSTAQNIFVNEVQKDHKPIVFISSLSSFLARKLLRALLTQNCFIIAPKSHNTLNNLGLDDVKDEKNLLLTQDFQEITEENVNIQYVYFFVDTNFDKNNYENLKNHTSSSTKHLYVNESVEVNPLSLKTTDSMTTNEKKKSTHIYLPYVYGPEIINSEKVLEIIEKENVPCLFITDAVHLLLKVMFGYWGDGGIIDLVTSQQNEKDNELGWKAKIPKEEGIKETREWIKNELDKKSKEKITMDKTTIIPELKTENSYDETNNVMNYSHENSNTDKEKIIEKNIERTKNLDQKIEEATHIHKIHLDNGNSQKYPQNNKPKQNTFIKPYLIIRKIIDKGMNRKRIIVLFGSLTILVYLVLYPVSVILISFDKGMSNLETARNLENQNNYEESLKYSSKAINNFSSLKDYSIKLGSLFRTFRMDKIFTNYQLIGEFGEFIAEGTKSEIIASHEMSNVLMGKEVSSNEEKNQNTNDAFVNLNRINENFAQAQAMIKQTNEKNRNTFQKIVGPKDLQEQRKISIFKYNLLKLLPEIIGIKDNKKYLFLFQNNFEIRPTGGFIGSYGLISFESGKIFDVKFDDTITIDNQLKGHVWPPAPILKYLGQPNWYLRDSNWNPDFPTSAQKAEWFFTKETGNQVDGVIAMDVTAIQYILEKIGPIKITELNKEITSNNLIETIMALNDEGIKNKSVSKDLMGVIFKTIWDNTSSLSNKQLNNLIEGILQGLIEKHIQIFMHDTNVQDYLYQNNFDGRLRTVACGKTECISDYLQIVDSNVGANKTNYYIKKSIQKVVNIENNNEILSEVILTMNNSSEVNVWPQGKYKTYLKTILPFESKILQLKIDGKIASFSAQREYETPVNGNNMFNIDVATESATPAVDMPKTSFGFYVEIPIKTTKTVSILYKLPIKISSQAKKIQYQLLLQKQAGVGYDPVIFSLSYPENFNVLKNSQEVILRKNQAILNTNLSKDRVFFIEWDKK